jgi:hypothetical protein
MITFIASIAIGQVLPDFNLKNMNGGAMPSVNNCGLKDIFFYSTSSLLGRADN